MAVDPVVIDGVDLFADWLERSARVRAELLAGNVSATFTGLVKDYSSIELLLARGQDEMSISLFCGEWKLLHRPRDDPAIQGWDGRYPVVQVLTDGGASVTLYEVDRVDT